MELEKISAAEKRRREFPWTEFLVRYLNVERDGEMYKLSLQDDAKNRVTALLSGANLWALVNALSACIEQGNAERAQVQAQGDALPFTRAYRR
ncbi:MAG: hypothetical protein HY348_13380 [Nitrospira defluvii]|nr:hypothetical protein [Nitrospira defluvii]